MEPQPFVADTTFSYHNANGLGAPVAGRAYLRDVALALSDVHCISETSWTKARIKSLRSDMQAKGHRLWAIAAETRNTVKSGTAVLVRSTVPARPGDGPIWAKPDGKALAVALTIDTQHVILLVAHLPHTDADHRSDSSLMIYSYGSLFRLGNDFLNLSQVE